MLWHGQLMNLRAKNANFIYCSTPGVFIFPLIGMGDILTFLLVVLWFLQWIRSPQVRPIFTPHWTQLTSQSYFIYFQDGYDLQFGTNVLGHAHFTLNLIPELLAGAKSSSDGKARIVNTSSSVVYFGPEGGIVWDTLKDTVGEHRKNLGTSRLYAQSKIVRVFSCGRMNCYAHVCL